MASSEKEATTGRMHMACPSLPRLAPRQKPGARNSHSRRLSKKPASFAEAIEHKSDGLHRGCSTVVYDFAPGDAETGLYYARARMYSAKLGRFIERDMWQLLVGKISAGDGYHDGYSQYVAYFMPNQLDPTGLYRSPLCMSQAYNKCLASAGYGGKTPPTSVVVGCAAHAARVCPNADNWYDLPPMVFCKKSDCLIAFQQVLAKCNSISGINQMHACQRAAQDLEAACNKIPPGGGGKFDGTSQPYPNDIQ